MASSAQVYDRIGDVKPLGEQGEQADYERHPKLPESGTFLLRVGRCTLSGDETKEAGVCQAIEHEIVESSTPLAPVGQTFVTTITHLTGQDADLKQRKVKNFLAAVTGSSEDDSTQPWKEYAMYMNEKQAFQGQLVRAKTDRTRRAKRSGRNFVPVTFMKA